MPGEKGRDFRTYDPKQTVLLTSTSGCRRIASLASSLRSSTSSSTSNPFPTATTTRPRLPRLQLKVLLYAYYIGVASSRGIEKAIREDVATRWLATDQHL